MSNQAGTNLGGIQLGTEPVSTGGSGGGGITQLTGDVTAGPGSGSQVATIGNNKVITAKINNKAVTLVKLDDLAQATVIGRPAGAGTGVPSGLTGAQLNAILGVPTAAQELIDSSTLVAAAGYTSPTWAAGRYKKVVIALSLVSAGTVTMTFPGIAGTYATAYAGGTVDPGNWLLTTAVTPATDRNFAECSIFPLTTGRERWGFSENMLFGASPVGIFQYLGSVSDTATDVTGIVLAFATGAGSGTVDVIGTLA